MRCILALCLLVLSGIGATAQTCEPVRFAKGESGVHIMGTVQPEARQCFSLAVRKGQRVTIDRAGSDENIAITVIGEGDARASFDFAASSNRVEFLVFQLFRSATPADYGVSVQVR